MGGGISAGGVMDTGHNNDPLGLIELLHKTTKALNEAKTPEAALQALREQWADMPILGPFPQRQQLLQDLAGNSARYQQALSQQLIAAQAFFNECLSEFQTSLETNEPPAEELSARWIAIAEPRYEAWLDQPETQDNIAELINAWSAYAHTLRALTDEMLEDLGMPSSRGLNDLAEELQRMRRRYRQQLNELRADIDALKAAQAPSNE